MRPTPAEDAKLNRAMGQASVANERRQPTDDVLVGGLPNVAELIRQREVSEREGAQARAKKGALQAYPVIGFGQGWFAVPSQSELGCVHLVHMNIFTDQPNSCTCDNPRKWCTHTAAARLYIDAAKDIYDLEQGHEAARQIIELREKRAEHEQP